MKQEPKTSFIGNGHGSALGADGDHLTVPAFCASDVLLELAPNLGIVFAAGATVALVGRSPQDLLKLSFLDLVSSKDRSLARRIMRHASIGERIESAIIHLDCPNGESPPLTLGGYHLPDMKGHYFLTLRLTQSKRPAHYPTEATGKGKTGLPKAQNFAEQVGKRLFALRESGGDYQLTFLRLGTLAELYQRLPATARRRLMTGLGRSLRSRSINGRLAGQFGEDCFGLVHTKDEGICTLLQEIAANAHELDPDKGGFDIDSATVDLDVTGISEADTVKAVIYAADHFCAAPAEDFAIETLSTSLYSMAGEVVHRSSELKALVSSGNFSMVFQPVVDLTTRRPHHFEALVRFESLGNNVPTYEAITFAEQTGLICDFDLAMCQKVVEWLDKAGYKGRHYMVAVNLSGSSIGSPRFVEALHKLLRKKSNLRHRILFEITESARITDLEAVNRSVQSLRDAGHKICLDDFGAGAAAFQYLRALDIDVVKIDGGYVRNALSTDKGTAFLKAMAGMCNDLGIATVAEWVEDEQCLNFLRECGVDYGQGYLFGAPSSDITTFEAPDPNLFN